MLKHYKLLFLLMPLLLLHSFATGQAERTFVKSFNLFGKEQVTVAFDGVIQIQVWDNPTVRVQMTVNTPSLNDMTLKAMAESGRYIIKNEIGTDGLILSAPSLKTPVKVNNGEVKEQISYIVFVPKGIVLQRAEASGKIVARLEP
jgi:hypothetical protein